MLPSSGLLSFADINVELRLASSSTLSLNDTRPRGLAKKTSGLISMADFYGKADRLPVTVTISATTTDYILNPSKISGYVAGITDVTFVINSGVVIGSTSTGSAGLTVSGFTSGDTISITNNGYIVGRGGDGGAGNASGASGGVALSIAYPTSITNNGTIGGGGGGGGGSADYSVTSGASCTRTTSYYGGSGGGGGAGYIAGNGGAYAVNGNAGSSGSPGSLTTGGGGASNGGDLGAAGGSSSYGGGAAGACTSGNANITWIVPGTRLGALN